MRAEKNNVFLPLRATSKLIEGPNYAGKYGVSPQKQYIAVQADSMMSCWQLYFWHLLLSLAFFAVSEMHCSACWCLVRSFCWLRLILNHVKASVPFLVFHTMLHIADFTAALRSCHTWRNQYSIIYLFIIKIVPEVQDRQRQKHSTWHR